jgi:UDP-N-acetylglucosamine---dolichyl-phosphate N-acetylglucosaminyltransferase
MKTIAIISAYNEEKTIAEVLEKTRPFVTEIIVVNDGSQDRTPEIAKEKGAILLSHSVNRGLGAAIGTGFEAARALGADFAITLDADGQHDPEEIPKFINAAKEGAEVVIGSRMIEGAKGMPWYRKVAQRIGNIATFVLFGAWVTDSQSGFRGFSQSALEKIEIKTNRMEISSELIAETHRNKLTLVEVPIKAIYTDYSLSKGQGFFVGIKTLIKLIVRRLVF